MSYQLDLQKDANAKPDIAMPPLPPEVTGTETTHYELPVENQGEIGQDLVENPIFPAQAAPEAESEPLQDQPKPGPQESFSRLRKERDELAKRLASYEAAQQQSRYEEPKPVYKQDKPKYEINDDDLMEGKHYKQVDSEIQQLKQDLYQQKQQNAAALAQQQIRNKFPDFDRVVNEDNIEQLKYSYPELASTLNSSTDLYSTAVSAYTMIKNLGIATPKEDYMAQKAQAQKNAAKPKPLASVNPQQGDSPLSKANAFANGFTEDVRKAMLKEMNDARKGM